MNNIIVFIRNSLILASKYKYIYKVRNRAQNKLRGKQKIASGFERCPFVSKKGKALLR